MDAELFRPDRWDEDMPLNDTPVNAKWGYLPFNGGPRICLGSKSSSIQIELRALLNTYPCSFIVDLALTEAAYTIVRIVQRFPTIKLPKGEVVDLMGVEKQTMTLVMSITEGCKVRLL